MRTTVLSRSVIAVASLAVGSAALVAAPATAATSDGVTRAEVVAAANALRADNQVESDSSTSDALVRALAAKVCGIPAESIDLAFGQPVDVPDSVDGLTVTALQNAEPDTDPESGPFLPFGSDTDSCTFAAVAPIGGATTLAGDIEVSTFSIALENIQIGNPSSTQSSTAFRLSGDVFTSPAVKTLDTLSISSLRSEGVVTTHDGTRVLTTTKIADKKSKAAKKAAKARYVKRIKAAKKTYAKAVKQAKGSPSKKASARLAYVSRRTAVKSAYRYAIADYKLVKTRSVNAQSRAFSVTVSGLGG